jgi:hypothetical protein
MIAVPSTQSWEADFGMSLVFLSTYAAANGKLGEKEIHYRIHNKRGSILANMREDLVRTALEGDATHLLFIDSDQTFPRDLLHRLLAHGKQVVAANIATKMLPSSTTARRKDGTKKGEMVLTVPGGEILEEVWRVGTGIMLIDLNLFKREGMGEPWFSQRWDGEESHFIGEDWGFCEKLEAAGVRIWVDHAVSWDVGHVGKLEYRLDLVEGCDASYSCKEESVL